MTWIIIGGVTLALMITVRLVADLLDRRYPQEEQEPWN